MPNRPELPTFYQHRSSVYDVMPDEKPMTWSIWNIDGWIGDITCTDDKWSCANSEQFATWQEAVVALLDAR